MKNNKLAKIINDEINKRAYHEEGETEERDMLLDDVELTIDGKKKKCRIYVDVEYTPIYNIDSDDFGELRILDDVDYSILEIGIDEDEDGTIYTEDKEKQILEENKDIIDAKVYHEVFNWAE